MRPTIEMLKKRIMNFNIKQSATQLTKKFKQTKFTEPKIYRLKAQGNINYYMQNNILSEIQKIQKRRDIDILILIVNSLGGDIQAAKNISYRLKKYSGQKKVPIHCFAEQYCLNSANLLLTAGEKCYAHKFSILGDFGYSYQYIHTKQLQAKYNFSSRHITPFNKQQQNSLSNKYSKNILNDKIVPQNEQLIRKLLQQQQQSLIEQLIKNRRHYFQQSKQTKNDKFIAQILNNPNKQYCDLNKSVQLGLIDGIIGVQEYIIQNYPKSKIIQKNNSKWLIMNPLFEMLKQIKDSFKFQPK